MQTQVTRIITQCLIDPVEHSESVESSVELVNQANDSIGANNGSLVPATHKIFMSPRRDFRDRPARCNVEEQELPNAPEMQPQGEVTNAEFREAIRMLS
uniref:Gag-pol polyprotein n=1 Tax=Solanum tuberosum TaxID=4113 RepID=M1DZR6_SOLTU